MFDIHQEFGLTDKVVATTTDNGSNYRAAFEQFGSSMEPLLQGPDHPVDDEEAEEQLLHLGNSVFGPPRDPEGRV